MPASSVSTPSLTILFTLVSYSDLDEPGRELNPLSVNDATVSVTCMDVVKILFKLYFLVFIIILRCHMIFRLISHGNFLCPKGISLI